MEALNYRKIGIISIVAVMLTAFLSFNNVSAATDSKSNLTFTTTLTDNDKSVGTLKVDLYRIADIEWNEKDYVLKEVADPYKEVFPEGETGYVVSVNITKNEDGTIVEVPVNKDFDKLEAANKVATIVFGEGSTIQPETLEGDPLTVNGPSKVVNDGLYLAIVKGDAADYIKKKGENYVSFVNGDTKEYDFSPYLVFINSDTQVDMTVDVKYESTPLMGELVIEKELMTFAGNPVTFVFEIKVKEPGSEIYESFDVASITYTADDFGNNLSVDDFFKSVTISNIPVGSKVKVTEIYAGSGYIIDSDSDDEIEIDIVTSVNKKETEAYEPAKVTFVNVHDDKHKNGYGINNEFKNESSGWKYVKSSGGSDQ